MAAPGTCRSLGRKRSWSPARPVRTSPPAPPLSRAPGLIRAGRGRPAPHPRSLHRSGRGRPSWPEAPTAGRSPRTGVWQAPSSRPQERPFGPWRTTASGLPRRLCASCSYARPDQKRSGTGMVGCVARCAPWRLLPRPDNPGNGILSNPGALQTDTGARSTNAEPAGPLGRGRPSNLVCLSTSVEEHGFITLFDLAQLPEHPAPRSGSHSEGEGGCRPCEATRV